MKRTRNAFICQQCGHEHPRWAGRCGGCGAWNALVEEARAAGSARFGRPPAGPIPVTDVPAEECARLGSGIRELDRVLGGGFVPGSAILIGGEPGVGKSTLLLEAAAHRAGAGGRPLYVSAEESAAQIALRAERLGLARRELLVLAEDRLEVILDLLLDDPPELLVLDSIQTIRKESLGSAAGSVAQVRECAAELTAAARRSGTALVLVGHVTKDGAIAGPRVLEHLVDAVLDFEGERESELRLLRTLKNRHGPAGEVAVFAMGERGLIEPEQPAALFLGAAGARPGASVTATMEGSRVFLVEVQALTATAAYGPPRVRANGLDVSRAVMLAAVLTRRAGLALGDQDIHLNVAGGFRLSDPACDLAVCAALASSFLDRALPGHALLFGEVGLGGEVRDVKRPALRLREAKTLGFTQAFTPAGGAEDEGLEVHRVRSVDQMLAAIF